METQEKVHDNSEDDNEDVEQVQDCSNLKKKSTIWGFELDANFVGNDKTWDFNNFIRDLECLVKSLQGEDTEGFAKVWNFIRCKYYYEIFFTLDMYI